MKKTMFAIMLFVFATRLFAATGVKDSASIIFPLFDIGVGARALAMGEAFSAIADDATAVYWNPAGLAQVRNMEIGLTYDKWLMDSFYQHLVAAIPLGAGTLGFNALYMSAGSFEQRTGAGALEGTTSPFIGGGVIGYGIGFGEAFSAGASIKFITQSISGASDIGFGGDAAILLKFGIVSLGVNAQNLGVSGSFSLPMNIRGASR